jgi:hypothetical protein
VFKKVSDKVTASIFRIAQEEDYPEYWDKLL